MKLSDYAIVKDGEVVQIGAPEAIVANPIDDYAPELTGDVLRYKVISVGKIMRAASTTALADGAKKIREDAKPDKLIDIAIAARRPLAVVDNDNQIVGETASR